MQTISGTGRTVWYFLSFCHGECSNKFVSWDTETCKGVNSVTGAILDTSYQFGKHPTTSAATDLNEELERQTPLSISGLVSRWERSTWTSGYILSQDHTMNRVRQTDIEPTAEAEDLKPLKSFRRSSVGKVATPSQESWQHSARVPFELTLCSKKPSELQSLVLLLYGLTPSPQDYKRLALYYMLCCGESRESYVLRSKLPRRAFRHYSTDFSSLCIS